MSEPARDRWLSIGLSVLLHGSIIGLLGYGWWRFEHQAVAPSPSIMATVVDARTLKGMGVVNTPAPRPKSAPVPAPVPAPAVQGPPLPSAQELALRAQAAQAEAQHAAAAAQERLQRQQAKAAREHADAAKRANARARKLAEERKMRAEAKRQARAKKLAEERRAKARKAAEALAAQQRAARIAQLQQSLQEEEQSDAAARAGLASWQSEITGRIEDAWIKPPTAKPGIDCVLNVTQVPGGTVSNVSIGRCNGDEAVRESIEAAVYRASPLPPPPEPSLFQRQLIIEFKPN